jgi:hypothetical protein
VIATRTLFFTGLQGPEGARQPTAPATGVQPKNWLTLNTFRTQSQIDAGGGVCVPEPRG